MADSRANIDLAFRNGLKNHEILPPEDIWENVSRSIQGKQKKIFPAFMHAAAFAALILATGTSVYVLLDTLTDTLADAPALTLNQDVMPEGAYIAPVREPAFEITSTQTIARIPVASAGEETNQQEKKDIGIPGGPAPVIAGNSPFKPAGNEINLINLRNFDVSGKMKGKTFDITYAAENKRNSEAEKWKMGAFVLPSYYSKINLGNDNAAADYLKSEKTAFSYSGGLSFTYEVSRRISFLSGVIYSSIGQRIEEIASFTGFSRYNESKSASDFSILTTYGYINSTNKDVYFLDNSNVSRVQTRYSVDVFDPMKVDLSHLSNSLIQSMSYLEIPLIMKYKLVDRKMDINMLGGFSYGFLIGNTSYINSGGIRYTIGRTGGLNPVIFSSSVGMGMEYKLTDNITFNLEPVMRYYITPPGSVISSKIHPYSFGILSGLFYNF